MAFFGSLVSLLEKKNAINIFSKKQSIFIKAHWILIIISLQMQLIYVGADYGLSVAVFGFVVGIIVFEILLIFGKMTHFWKKMSHSATKSTVLKIISARTNPKAETEMPRYL